MATLRRHVPEATPDALSSILRYYTRRLEAAETEADFRELYTDALQLPRTSARVNVQRHHGLAINGTFRPDVISRSTLLHAFRAAGGSGTPVPMVLKISIDTVSMRHEADVWTDLQEPGSPHLVPNELIDLQVWCLVL